MISICKTLTLQNEIFKFELISQIFSLLPSLFRVHSLYRGISKNQTCIEITGIKPTVKTWTYKNKPKTQNFLDQGLGKPYS